MSTPDDKMSAEDRLIARFFEPLAIHPGALNLSDDAAFITPPPGCDFVLKTDAIIGGVHLFAAKDEQADWTGYQLKRFGVRYLVGALHRDREPVPRAWQYRLKTPDCGGGGGGLRLHVGPLNSRGSIAQ